MLLLRDTDSKLNLVTSAGTGGAYSVDAYASWAEFDSPSTYNIDAQHAAITTATTTDLAGSPTGTYKRKVTEFFVSNKHATASVDAELIITDGTTPTQLEKVTLLPGERIAYGEERGIHVFDASGAERTPNFGMRFARKTADQAYALTAKTDISDLSWPIAAGGVYEVYAMLVWTTSIITTGVGFSLNGPTIGTGSINGGVQIIGNRAAVPSAGDIAAYSIQAYDGGVPSLHAEAITTDYIAMLTAYIVNGANAGTLAVRGWAETAATVTFRQGSYARLIRVA